MEQEALFHEDLNGALGHVISALGGAKDVGVQLWPSLSADTAGRKVSHCLNHDHAQQFHPQEVIWLLSEARKRGVHSAMSYICREVGYADPQPIEPEDEAAALQRLFVEAVNTQAQILKRMERLSLPMKAVR